MRYLGDSRALVRTAHGLSLETSSVPLRAGQSGESERPVDLSLRPTASAFAAVNPLQAVSVSRRLSGGVVVGSAGIRVTPQGSDVTGSRIGDQGIFFANVATRLSPFHATAGADGRWGSLICGCVVIE